MSQQTPTQVIIPIIVGRDLKYYYSGGYYNNNANASIGGEMSSFQITSGALNGLFDRVTTNEAQIGDTEYRCIYLKNTNQTRKLLKAKIWIETSTTSPNTSVALSIGSAGMNGTEPMLPHENIQPPMVFFAVPFSMPETSNLGDMYPGDSIGLWIRWKIEPNTASIANDYFVIRLDGEREPEIIVEDGDGELTPPPATGCPSGQHWNPITAQCVPISTPITCPTGYVYNEEQQMCIPPVEPPPQGCPANYHWDVVTGTCVPDDQNIVCPIGYVYSESQQRCIPESGNPPSVPLIKFAAISDTTTGSDEAFALIRQNLDITSSTEPSFLLTCGDATHSDGNVDPFIDFCRTLGTMFPNNIFPSLGNHDDSEDGASSDGQDIIDAFPTMGPNGYYAVTRRNIKCVIMNTQADYDPGSAQHTFVMQQLQQADSDPNIKWIVVTFHKPIVGSAGNHAFLTDLRDWLAPACDTYHVDFILTGHNHVYSRTKPVKFNSSNPSTPTIVVDQSTGTYTNIDGRIYMSVASGDRTTGGGFSGSQEAWIAYRDGSPSGATFFTLQDNGNQMVVEHKDTSNRVNDSATYNKPGATVPPEITCPTGYYWSESEGRCLVSPQSCPTGQHWDQNQNRCVADVITSAPDTNTNFPVTNVEWYYTSMTASCLLTDATLTAGNHTSDGVLLASNASGVSSHEILNDEVLVETGGGNGRVYWDYHTLARWAQDDQPGFNIAMFFKFKWVNNDNVSVKDGNHGTTGYAYNGQNVFGGFGFSLHRTEIQSKVEYYHNFQGDEVRSVYPGNRQLTTNTYYKCFFTLRTDRNAGRVVLNVWLDYGDGLGWIKILTDRYWSNSGWNPGSVPSGDDSADIEAGPANIKRTHMWTRNNVGPSGADLPITDVRIGTLNFIS